MSRERAKFLLIGFIFCNLIWQIMVWCSDLVHSLLAVGLIFLFPIFAGIAVYGIFLQDVNEDWTLVFLVSGVFFPVFYFSLHATRAPEYVKFVHSNYNHYAGRTGELESTAPMFYELTDFAVKDAKAGEFGASYNSSSRKSSTSYSKHFVVPLFDKNDLSVPRLWLYDSISSRLRIDNGDGGYYGFRETNLSKPLYVSTLYGKKVASYEANRAIAQYLNKRSLPAIEAPLVLALVDEPAESYYRKGRILLWVWTVLLNLIFMGFSFYTSGKTRKSDKI